VLNYTLIKSRKRSDVVFLSMVPEQIRWVYDNPHRLNVAYRDKKQDTDASLWRPQLFLEQKNSSELRQLAEKHFLVNKIIKE